MPLSPQHAKHTRKNWSDLLRQHGHKKPETAKLSDQINDNASGSDLASLFHDVETLQESAALVIPGPGKSLRTLHHCFSDLQREKVVGVFGLRDYSPFKEVSADYLVTPFQVPTTRDSQNLEVPSFSELIELEKPEDLATKRFIGGDEDINSLKSRPSGMWVNGEHLTKFYGKTAKAASVAFNIINSIPEEMTREAKEKWKDTFYDQLIFLWAVEKGFLPSITMKDPPDSDETQTLIEEVNGLLAPDGKNNNPHLNGEDPTEDPERGRPEKSRDRTGQSPGKSPGKPPKKSNRKRHKRRNQGRHRSPSSSSGSSSSTSSSESSSSDEDNQDKTHGGSRETQRRRGRSPHRRSPSRSPSPQGNRSPPNRHRSRSRSKDNRRRSTSQSRRRPSPPKKKRKHKRSHRQRSGHDNQLMSAFVQGLTALTQNQLDTTERERRKTSVLNRLSKPQAFLFDALSARDWYDARPTRTAEADMILEDRDIERNWNLLIDMTSKWPGAISKPAFVQFLTKGFVSEDRPGGFTAFMFQPPRKYAQGKKDRKRNLRNVLGKSGEVDEEDLDFYAKNDFYIPKSVYEGEVQIQMTIRLLDLLTNHQSIASDGYRFGLEFLSERQNTFHDEQGKDELFMARYINLLDSAFQNFAGKLAELHQTQDPVYSARHKLRGLMAKNIERVMQDIDFDVMPNLPLPPRLQETNAPTSTSNKKPKGRDKPRNTTDKDDDEVTEAPAWWTKNPSPHEGWALPSGKAFKDFFDTTESRGRANLARFPRTKHHNPSVRLKRNLCARYQVEGECKKKCNLVHLPFNKMDSELRQEASEAFKEAYRS